MTDPDEGARLLESWHANAAPWTEAVRSGAIESRRLATDAAILDAVLGRRPRKVLDLGCGEGWLVRALAARGVAAVGVDGAAPLVEAASSAGGSFVRATYAELAETPERCGDGFDLVVANFALLDEDIEPLLGALARIMTADAWLLVQTLHPLAAGGPYEDGWRTEHFRGFGDGEVDADAVVLSYPGLLDRRAARCRLRSAGPAPTRSPPGSPPPVAAPGDASRHRRRHGVSLEIWIAFTLASAALLAVPGPTVILVVSYALGRGRTSGFATVPGVALGDLTAMTVSLLGAGAVLAASATLFTVLKLAGAFYLVWLGIQLWRAGASLDGIAAPHAQAARSRMFWNAYVVTALNPKSVVFFVAFVPQFVDTAAPLLAQFVILEATFVGLAAVNAAVWALLAGQMRSRLQDPFAVRLVHRIGGSFLIGAGLLTALSRRAA